MKRLIGLCVVLCFSLLLPISAGAIPSLGVIPTETLNTWDPSIPFEGPFAFTGGDPTYITVWYGNESGDVDHSIHVWIGSTEALHTFGGEDLPPYSDGSPPNSVPSFWHTFGTNYAADLGTVESSGWEVVTSGPLFEGGGTFYTFTAEWTLGLGDGEWIYAMADESGNLAVFDNGKDAFSPPTMSTVPEPATLLLVGSGLAMLWLFGRRRFRTGR